MTDAAPALMFNDAAAFGAGSEHAFFAQGVIGKVTAMFIMLANSLGNGISTRYNLVLAKASRLMAADADKLPDYGLRRHAAPPSQGHQAAYGLTLTGSAPAGFPNGIEKFKDPLALILINGDIHGTTAGGHLIG
jgi:hypothetical protein